MVSDNRTNSTGSTGGDHDNSIVFQGHCGRLTAGVGHKAHELHNLRLYKRAQGLLWVNEGRSLREIGRLLGVSVKRVWNWLQRFFVKGLSWLRAQHYQGRGRKAKLTGPQKQPLYEWVKAGPQANGFTCGVWNSAMIAERIGLRFGARYHPRYLSSLLKKLGLSYQKARFICDRADEEAFQRARQQWVEQTWPSILRAKPKPLTR
jgi:transposase